MGTLGEMLTIDHIVCGLIRVPCALFFRSNRHEH